MPSVKKPEAILAAFLLVLLGLRFFLITADPSVAVSFSHGLSGDEGYRTDYPRITFFNRADQVFIGNYCEQCIMSNAYNIDSPVINAAYLASFYLFGPGIFSSRLVAVLLSVASVAILFFLLKAVFGSRTALIASVLLACNFLFFTYSRLALHENFLLFFIAASFYAMHLAFKSNRKCYALLAIIFVSVAFTCKPTSMIAFPAIGILFLYFAWERVAAGHRLKFVAASAVLFALVIVFLGLFTPNTALQGVIILLRIPDSLFVLARNLLIAPVNQSFAVAPLFSLLGFAAALLFTYQSVREPNSEKKFFKLAFAAMLFFGFFAFGAFTYQPPRYFYLLFPSLAVFSGLFLDRLLSRKPLFSSKGSRALLCKALLLFSAAFIAYAVASNLVKYFVGIQDFSQSILWYCAFFAVAFVCFLSVARLFFNRNLLSGKRALKAGFCLACLLFAGIVLLQLSHYAVWASNPKFTLLQSSTRFAEIASRFDEPVVAGHGCLIIGRESDVLCQSGGLGAPIKEELFSQLGVDMLAAGQTDWEMYKDEYNSYESVRFVFIEQLRVGSIKINLFYVEQKS